MIRPGDLVELLPYTTIYHDLPGRSIVGVINDAVLSIFLKEDRDPRWEPGAWAIVLTPFRIGFIRTKQIKEPK